MPEGRPDTSISHGLKEAVLAFERLEIGEIHPDRTLDYLPNGLSLEARKRLVNAARLRGRLDDLAGRKLDLAPIAWDDFQRPGPCLALLDVEQLKRAGHLAAATLEGHACRRLVFKEERQRLDALLPEGSFGFIIRHLDLAWPRLMPATLDQLVTRIETLGEQLLGLFRNHLRPALADRLRLKLPQGTDEIGALDPELDPAALAEIMRSIAQEIYGYGRH